MIDGVLCSAVYKIMVRVNVRVSHRFAIVPMSAMGAFLGLFFSWNSLWNIELYDAQKWFGCRSEPSFALILNVQLHTSGVPQT